MPVAVIVDWYGPYTGLEGLREVVQAERQGVPRVLYMALARWNKCQNVGLTTSPRNRIHEGHDQLNHKDNERFYIGQIVTQRITSPRHGGQPPDLRLAEHALISFLQPALNKYKKSTEPLDCILIFSCFYHPKSKAGDYEPDANPLPKFPILLAHNTYSQQRWFWEAGKMTVR